jgi:hypothetical protein
MILAKRLFPIPGSLRVAFVILFTLLSFFVEAQNDSLHATRAGQPQPIPPNADSTILYNSTADEQRFSIKRSTQSTDTILDNLHNYYQMGVLGNMGLPSYALLAGTNSYYDNGFFKWMILNNANDLFSSRQPVYFYPKGKVYTKVFAAMGQKQEQVFKILHSQNIGRINISLQFNRYSCIGFYQNQKSLTDNLLFSSHAQVKSGRLGYNFHFLFNKLKYQLNGGIDTAHVNFEKEVLVQKQLFPVNLSSTKQNIRTSEANLRLFYRLNADSTGTLHYLEYESNYQGNYWMNSEGLSDTGRYSNQYFYSNSGINVDSISFKRWTNSAIYKLSSSNKFVFYLGYKNEFNHYHQFFYDKILINHIATGGIRFDPRVCSVKLNVQYVAAGFNAGNYNAQFTGKIPLGKNFHVSIEGYTGKGMGSYMNKAYYAPHFIWSNTFSPITTTNGELALASNKYRFRIGGFVQNQVHPIYYDTAALPTQYKGSTVVTRLFVQKDLKLGHIHFNNTINYQTTQNTDIIRLPQYYTFHQLYYEGKLFKKALWLQFGVQARYVSAFKANAFMPATDQFYLQDQKEYGNYVFVDVFLNAQIDRFRFFLLASHINQGLSGANYMLCPTYAMPDRSLKAGLCWMFFD